MRRRKAVRRKRISSSLVILNFRRTRNIPPEAGAQVLGGAQSHFAACEQLGQIQLHAGNAQQAGSSIRLKLDEYIYIAVWSEILSQRRTEDSESFNSARSAKSGKRGL